MFRRFITFPFVIFLLCSCASPSTPEPVLMTPPTSQLTPAPQPAFETGIYPNLFRDYLGKSDVEIQAKIDSAFEQLFYGDDRSERVYYPVGSDMAYISDIANDDVRTEGMSYGMMIAVQLNKKEEFDRLWKWVKTYMYQRDGGYKGYFAWHCKTDGTQLDANPASDGEIWFITALFFADGRWGSGEGIYNYRAEAQAILDTARHAEGRGALATDLFDPQTKQVVFVPQVGRNSQFTDPSYHMPHYYELWARWADKDNDFWAEAAQVSREYLKTAVHPQTGLAPNYSEFDGSPVNDRYNGNFRYDAFRVGANIGMDYVWFAPSEWHVEQSNRLLRFFASQGMNDYKAEYLLDGTPDAGHRSTGLMATNAVAALAADRSIGEPFVQALWDLDIPTGKYRYYDGLLTMLALLQVSGNFRIYEPGAAPAAQALPTSRPQVNGRFVPASGHALLLVGQTVEDINAYFDATVTAPGGVALNIALEAQNFDGLKQVAAKYPNSVLSVGLNLDGSANPTDEQVNSLLDALTSYNRPVFLHIGYGRGNTPEAYVSAWKRFWEGVQIRSSQNIALVWEAGSCETSNLADFYAGDEAVDWIGANYECAEDVIRFARQHFKPVILTAGSQGADWDTWFAPFFQFVLDNNEVVRAVIYLNNTPMNNAVLERWKGESTNSFWLRAAPNLFSQLGFTK